MRRFILSTVFFFVIGAVVALMFFYSRGGKVSEEDIRGRLRIVTTFTPLYIFTKNIVGDAASVENLLSEGVGPHDYSFTPADVRKIANADVMIKQGRGLDDWVDEVIRAAGRNDLVVIVASEGLEPHRGLDDWVDEVIWIQAPELSLVRPTPDDPHLWLDPFLAAQEVERIRDGLMALDPANRDTYALLAERYILKLLGLDREIRAALADIPRRDFVAFHPAFRYFAYEYGLREVGVIEEVPGEKPSPQELTRLVDVARRADVRVVFSEPQFSPKIVELLARDYGLRIAELDPLETGEFRLDYYEEIMRKNLAILIAAFK